MIFKMYKGVKWVGMRLSAVFDSLSSAVLIGGFVFFLFCVIGGGIYVLNTTLVPKWEWLAVGEVGGVTNKMATFSFQSDEPVHLKWSWQNSNQWPDIHVSCDLINEGKKQVYFTTENNYLKIEPGAKARFFVGSLTNLIPETSVYFRTEEINTTKKLKINVVFDEDFKPEPPIKVWLHNDTPVL